MNRRQYQDEVIRLYLKLPDTPNAASRADRKVAAHLFDQDIPLERLAHAMRLATLRRHSRAAEAPPHPPVRALAYYRHVLHHLADDELEHSYQTYVTYRYNELFPQPLPRSEETRPDSQIAALSDRR